MKQSELLRKRTNQHKPKNTKSKIDDKRIYTAMTAVQIYLERKFGGVGLEEYDEENPVVFTTEEEILASGKHPASIYNDENNSLTQFDEETELLTKGGTKKYKDGKYYIVFEKSISIEYMINMIKKSGVRHEFDMTYIDRKIIPDGGVLYLLKKGDPEFKHPLVIAEVKRQGTNDARAKEGLKKQATGNAIERLGKNLIGIKAMMNHDKITPFVVFGWGVDFTEPTVLAKLNVLNEFYKLNTTYVFKKDGNSDVNDYSPTSFYFRKEQWEVREMFSIMADIAETALQSYIY